MTKPRDKSLTDFFGGVEATHAKKRSRAQQQADKEAAEQAAHAEALEQQRQDVVATFPDYFDAVEPIVKALENLPPREGNEFFVRVDLNPKGWDCNTNVRGPEIGMWIFYTRRADDATLKENLPMIHGVALDEKGTTPDDGKSVDLEINDLPVFRVRSKPQADGTMKIQAEHYTTDYICTGRKTGGSGSYRSGRDGNMYREQEYVSDRQDVTDIKDLPGIIGSWVAEAAPERLEDVRKVLTGTDPAALREKITFAKPLSFKKKAQDAP